MLRLALEYAPLAFAKIDSDHRVIDCNRIFLEKLEMEQGLVVGTQLTELVPDIDPLNLKHLFDSSIAFHQKRTTITKTGIKVRQNTVWDVMGWPIRSQDGPTHHAAIAILDASEEAELEHQKDEFVAAFAHDIKNPLLGQQKVLNTLLLEEQGRQIEPPKVVSTLNLVRNTNEALLLTLSNLLEIYKRESNLYIPTFASLDFAEIITDCLFELKALITLNQIEVVTNIARGLPFIEADRRAMRRLFLNLLSYAVNFTFQGGKIQVSAYTKKDRLSFTITYNGPEISQEEQKLLFQRSPKDFGLALYICKCIVEDHGGAIAYKSKQHLGTTLTVSLPTTHSDSLQTARS